MNCEICRPTKAISAWECTKKILLNQIIVFFNFKLFFSLYPYAKVIEVISPVLELSVGPTSFSVITGICRIVISQHTLEELHAKKSIGIEDHLSSEGNKATRSPEISREQVQKLTPQFLLYRYIDWI